jgi:hypothetical protein
MGKKTRMILRILFNSGIAVICTLLLGLLFTGWDVFIYRNTTYEFVACGILGSTFFFSLGESVADSLALLFLLFVAQCVLITKSFRSTFFAHDIAFFILVSVAIYFHFTYIHKPRRLNKILEPLVLAALMALAFLAALFSLHLMHGVVLSLEQLKDVILPVMQNGFLIGFGIGLGILFVEMNALEKIRNRIASP